MVDEVTLRTPGYVSWQQEVWLACCDDACAFHGDATRSELSALDRNALAEQLAEWGIDIGFWKKILANYEPGGNPAVYRFQCLHCGKNRYGLDFT